MKRKRWFGGGGAIMIPSAEGQSVPRESRAAAQLAIETHDRSVAERLRRLVEIGESDSSFVGHTIVAFRPVLHEAADEIERKDAEIARLQGEVDSLVRQIQRTGRDAFVDGRWTGWPRT